MAIVEQDMLAAVAACEDMVALDAVQAAYVGKKGSITLAFKGMKELSVEEKKTEGARLKGLRVAFDTAYAAKYQVLQTAVINAQLAQDPVDLFVNTEAPHAGHMNLLAKERRHVEAVAHGLGFSIEHGYDVVSKKENFYDLNIPADHPATEMHDTIYMYDNDAAGDNFVLRTHTTAHDVDYIKKYGTPTRVITVGRVYRYEKMDATHDTAFWQVDGIYVDKGVSIAHFKSFIDDFLEALLGEKKVSRLRPAYFPFVEPGYEIDIKYNMGNKTGDDNRVELLGAGMLHPHVLRAAGLDPDVYSGFAFGMGLSRLVAIKYGIKDIRVFTNGDVRFVKSF